MHVIKVRGCDTIEDKNGTKLVDVEEELVFFDEEVRDNDFCTLCGVLNHIRNVQNFVKKESVS